MVEKLEITIKTVAEIFEAEHLSPTKAVPGLKLQLILGLHLQAGENNIVNCKFSRRSLAYFSERNF